MTCVITEAAAEAMRRHAIEQYPREACGLLIGKDGPEERWVERVVAARNDAPEDHRYTIPPEDFLRAEREARIQGLDVVGFYHSHPDAESFPSSTDERQAWPHYTYVIVGVSRESAGAARGFRRDGDRLEPETLRVAEPEARG